MGPTWTKGVLAPHGGAHHPRPNMGHAPLLWERGPSGSPNWTPTWGARKEGAPASPSNPSRPLYKEGQGRGAAHLRPPRRQPPTHPSLPLHQTLAAPLSPRRAAPPILRLHSRRTPCPRTAAAPPPPSPLLHLSSRRAAAPLLS